MNEGRPARLDSLTGLRFFAALGVLLTHINSNVTTLLGSAWCQFGYLGVPFFFALSGFVLTWTATADDTARAFWRRRFARVYPLYLVSLLPGVILGLAGQAEVSALAAILSVVLLQGWFVTPTVVLKNPNGPGWSISAEAFFYALFPLLIPRARSASGRMLACSLVVLLAVVPLAIVAWDGVFSSWFVPYYAAAYQVAPFLSGVILAEAFRRGMRFPRLRWSLSLAVAVIFVLGLADGHAHVQLTNRPLVEIGVLPFVLLLIGSAATADIVGAPSLLRSRSVVKLGVWSYALYLTQFPVIMVIEAISPNSLFGVNRVVGSLSAVALILLCIALAWAAHRLIEAPWNDRLRHAPKSVISEQETVPAQRSEPELHAGGQWVSVDG